MRKLIILWCAFLFGLSAPALANTSEEVRDMADAKALVEDRVEQDANRRAGEHREKIMQGAVDALVQTRKALEALDNRKVDEALHALEIATGKLELMAARHPDLALAPTSVTVTERDVYGSVDAIRKAINEAEDALDNGDVQRARRLLKGLGSEVVISVTSLPLSTWPDAIKEVVPMIDDGNLDLAREHLQAVLNTLVVTDHVDPLPIRRAVSMLGIAEGIAAKPDRTEADEELLSKSMMAVREQVGMAELLGYGDGEQFDLIYRQLAQVEEKVGRNESRANFFSDIREAIARLWRS